MPINGLSFDSILRSLFKYLCSKDRHAGEHPLENGVAQHDVAHLLSKVLVGVAAWVIVVADNEHAVIKICRANTEREDIPPEDIATISIGSCILKPVGGGRVQDSGELSVRVPYICLNLLHRGNSEST